jgi:manganese efflux pump family protein
MGLVGLVFVALALATDAFAVAVATGLTLNPLTRRHVFRMAFHFGLFQALMPAIGWLAGTAVHRYIAAFDHWIAFGLLAIVGGRMVVGALRPEGVPRAVTDPTKGWQLVLLSVATSIDALAVGLSLAMLGSPIVMPALVIGVITMVVTGIGMEIGQRLGQHWGQRVEVVGGLVLIAIGVRILAAHIW